MEVGIYLKQNMKPDDFVIILPINSHPIYQLFDLKKYTSSAHGCYLNNPAKHPIWNEKLIFEFQKANWLVFEITENLKLFIGEEGSTLEFLKMNPEVNNIISNEFELCKQVNNLVIYKRNNIYTN